MCIFILFVGMNANQEILETLAPQLCPAEPAAAQLQHQTVRYHCNKFAISRFALGIADGVPEVLLQGFQVAPVPGHLDGVANLLPCSLV